MKNLNLISISIITIIAVIGWLLFFQANNKNLTGKELGVNTTNDSISSELQNAIIDFKNSWSKQDIIIGLDDAYPPIGFRNEKGELVGFDIDLAKATFSKIGLNVVFKPVAWDGVILNLMNKDIDVIWNGMTITDSRKEQINFSNSYLTASDDFIIRANSGITKLSDLQNKVIGVQAGSSQETELNGSSLLKNGNSIRTFASNDEAFLDLKTGRLDAILMDNYSGRYYISNINKDAELYSVINGGFGDSFAGVGIRKEDGALKAIINLALDELKSNGSAKSISESWFGADLIAK